MVDTEDGVWDQPLARNPDGAEGVMGIVFLFIDILGLKLLPTDHKYAGMLKFAYALNVSVFTVICFWAAA